ncbi:MAG: hypothetical protein J0L56_15045 [Chitinophagales bacterium]|nr:hypothetical protein [Chitinophagales bacterium]
MQTIDSAVSKEKFDTEVSVFLANEAMHRKRGILLLKHEFPDVIFIFSAVNLKPASIVFAVKINFNDYDLSAPSVRFIDPFTWEPMIVAPVLLYRKIVYPDKPAEIQHLTQKDTNGLPFICIPGIREYHEHPAHTGDSWLLHRNKCGEGTLGFIVEKLFDYGISAINSYQFQIQLQAPQALVGVDLNLIPE